MTDRSNRKARSLAVTMAAFATLSMMALPRTGASSPDAPMAAITFSSPVVVDPTHAYGEPDVKIDSTGLNWYDSGPWGTGTQRSIWNWSSDGGHTFHSLHSPAIGSPAESDTTVPCPDGTPPPCPGGGDTEISIDRSGKVYYSDLAALVTLKTATWDPANHVMETGLIANEDQTINGFDRQWFGMWDPVTPPPDYTGPLPINYLASAEAIGALECDPPLLGACSGAFYTTDGVTYIGPTMSYPEVNASPLVVDQQTGTVLQGISVESLNDVGIAILTRDPATPDDPALKNAQIIKIADLPPDTTTFGLFPVTALDQARNAYVAWVTRGDVGQSTDEDPDAWQIFYSYATAATGWTVWSTPTKLNAPPANTNVMPWAVAGADGRLAVVWYGTSDSADNPSTDDAHQAWDVYLAMVTNADTPTPTIQRVKVTRHPMHYGTICLEGLGCIEVQGNRNLADFFEVDLDPRDGAVIITYNDTSNELIQEVPPIPDGFVDHRGAAQVMVVRQNGGTGLFGTSVTGDPRTGKSIVDDLDDATFDPVYSTTNIPETDLSLATVKVDRSNPDNLKFDLYVGDLADPTNAIDATGAQAVDYVVRFTGPAVEDPDTGTKNPLYYVAAELLPDGSFTFFAGEAQSVELCSVSACTPHILNYPAPPQGGTFVTGSVVATSHTYGRDYIEVVVPRSLFGAGLAKGTLLESFSGFVLARNKSASLPITTEEGEVGITPVMVDGMCCRDLKAP